MFENLETGGKAQKYAAIREAAAWYSVTSLCTLFRVSKSGYYAYLKRKTKEDRDAEAKALIRTVYDRYNGVYGYRQIQLFMFHDHGVWMNHKKVLRLMQALGIRSKIRRKHRFHYASSIGARVAENVLKREFKADAPHQKWVTDVTQFRVVDTWLYLSAVKDLFNNEIVAYQISSRNDNQLVLQTFTNAFEKREDVSGLIVHSDQGFQYTSYDYHDMLQRLAPESACHAEAIVLTMPQWRASSRISKRKRSTLMIYELLKRHKGELRNLFNSITKVDRKED